MKKTLFAALLLALPGLAQAHEIWIERDGDGPARIYLGEPAEPRPPGGDPEFEKLKAPRLLFEADAAFVRKAGFLEVDVPPGDVRASDDNVFAPWGEDGKRESVIYHARAGRSEVRALLPLEIAPLAANGNRFALLRDGKPVPATKIVVIAPDKASIASVTDHDGAFEVPSAGSGRYLLSAALKEEGGAALPGGKVDILHRITTTTFVAP
jgi:hypothetical protein